MTDIDYSEGDRTIERRLYTKGWSLGAKLAYHTQRGDPMALAEPPFA